MLWTYFSAGALDILFFYMDSIKYQQIKNKNLTESYNGP